MGTFRLGTLSSVSASLRPDLLAESTRVSLSRAGLLDAVGVVEIDPTLSDTGALFSARPGVEILDGLAA